MKRYHYHCAHCGTTIDKVGDAFVVDEANPTAFCSEKCIVMFYDSEIKHFESQERELREKLEFEEKIPLSVEEIAEFVENALEDADKVYQDKNELGQHYYYLHSHFSIENDKYFVIVIAKFFGNRPSFIYHHIITKNTELKNYYQIGQELSKSGEENELESGTQIKKEELVLPKVVLDDIEQMRSEFVAEMLEIRSNDDIAYEKFPLYENFLEATLEDPDEVFEYQDDQKRRISVNIKAYSSEQKSFFYYVVCLKLKPSEVGLTGDDDILIPMISYPSQDQKTYLHHQRGNCTTKKSIN